MPCYNELSGILAHANQWLLTELLRKKWGFKGVVVLNYGVIYQLQGLHYIAKDSADAAMLAVRAGMTIEASNGCCYPRRSHP